MPPDLHVLSTPPAFVLSQDQTLHKKISEQHPKQAVKSPKPNKRTNHHKPQKPVLASKKLLQRKNTVPSTRRGQKRGNQKVEHNHMPTNPSQCSRNTKQHSKRVRVPHTQPAHTNQQTTKPAGRQTNQHTTMHTKNKKYIGTLLSSQTSSAHHKKLTYR